MSNIAWLDPMIVLPAAAALFTACAAAAAWKSAVATKKSAEGQLVARFLEEYASSEMLESLRVLGNLAGANFQTVEIDDTLDGHRRRLQHYFRRAFKLYKGKLLSIKSLRTVLDVAGYILLFKVAEPLARRAPLTGADEEIVGWIAELRILVPPEDLPSVKAFKKERGAAGPAPTST